MKKGKDFLIAGLDIGTTAVRMAVGQLVLKENGQSELQVLGAADVPSEGVNRGVINSIEDVVSSVSACLERTERIIGQPIDRVWLGISGQHVNSQNSKGVVAVSKPDAEIAVDDINRALEAARAISTPLNYEVLHVLPRSFSVDGQSGIKDPVGMTGIRLEVDAQIILGSSAQIKNLTKAVYRAGLEIDDLVLSVLADSEAVLTNRQKELGVAVVNIGGTTTSVAVFEEGDILYTGFVPVGSQHITNDVAVGLRTTIDIAERVKVEYGHCMPEVEFKKDDIDLFDLGLGQHELVKRKFLSEVIEARTEEILYKVDQELRKIQRSGLLPAGVIFTGGGSKLPGLIEAAKKSLRLPASIGYPLNLMSVTDKVNDLSYTTAIGLVKWGSMMSGRPSHASSRKSSGKLWETVKSWSKTLIP